MDVTKFQLYPVHLALPCDTHSCRGKRAAFFLGKPQDPIGTITKICSECAEELKEAVLASIEPAIPAEEQSAEIVGDLNSAKIVDAHIEHAVIKPELPFEPETPEQEPDTVDVLEIDGKLITEFTVKELKQLAKEEQIEGYSDKNKDELIDLITAHFEKSEE